MFYKQCFHMAVNDKIHQVNNVLNSWFLCSGNSLKSTYFDIKTSTEIMKCIMRSDQHALFRSDKIHQVNNVLNSWFLCSGNSLKSTYFDIKTSTEIMKCIMRSDQHALFTRNSLHCGS